MPFKIDQIARDNALKRFALPECLHIPIAAQDEKAIETYIGDIEEVLSKGTARQAFLVRCKEPPRRDDRLPIWGVHGADILHQRMQVWVDVGYTRYRKAYQRAFPSAEIAGKVLSHAMNRRTAVLKGFQYVRITPVSRGANSSSGFSENWGVSLHSKVRNTPAETKPRALIQYADLCDLLLLMDMKLGGGIMTVVNEGQRLVSPRLQNP